MLPPLLLLVAVAAAYWVHVRWGRADLRRIELRSEPEVWDDIERHERQDEVAARAAQDLREPRKD